MTNKDIASMSDEEARQLLIQLSTPELSKPAKSTAKPSKKAAPEPVVEVDPALKPNPFGKLDSCRTCTLFEEPGPVPGNGNRNSKIMLIGEGPGADEIDYPYSYDPKRDGPAAPGVARGFNPKRFAPFVGGSGKFLWKILQHASIDRATQTFTTNAVKCRPPQNRNPTPHEVACCDHFLQEEINDVAPNVIVAVGDIALKALTGKEKISLWRGVPTTGLTKRPDGTPYKVFPTFHPAFILRAQYYYPFSIHDFIRVKKQSLFPEIERTPLNVVRDSTAERDKESLRAAIRRRGCFSFDFETTGLTAQDSTILILGVTTDLDTAHVLKWNVATRQFFQELMDDPTLEIIGQNILNFDLPFAEDKGLRIRWTNVFDTMVAFHLTNSSYGQTSVSEQNAGSYRVQGAEKDLSFIASNHTDIEYWKSRENYKGDIVGVCGIDCIATDRAAMHPSEGLKQEIARYDMVDLYYKHVLPIHPVLRRMTQRGVNIDKPKAEKAGEDLFIGANILEERLKEVLDRPDFNMNSPKQLLSLLYDDPAEGGLGLPVQRTKEKQGGRPTANKEALDKLANEHPEHAILKSIVTIRHARKMKSTFIDPMLETGRVHARFGVSKAANGRFNSWDPNAQNVPEDMRDIWIPDSDEEILISADSSQIEWRNAMVLSGDEVGLELLASGVDNHRAVAAETLGKPIESITDAERHASKFIVYGLGYGRGAPSIAAAHKLEMDFVQQFIRRFFARFRTFHQWRERLTKIVERDHYLANPWKRRRFWWTREITEIFNYPASSCAADMMIDQLLLLDAQLPKEATLRLTVHDEVVVNCPKDLARETIACVRTCMQQPWPQMVEASDHPEVVKHWYPDGWYVPADVGIGTNWKMCKSKSPEDKAAKAALIKHLGLQDLFKG